MALKRFDYPIKTLPSGDHFSLQVFRLEGSEPGPHCHIQSSVHGAELQGNAVIYQLMDYFLRNPSFRGSIHFVPLANPAAVNCKLGTYTYGRFNPITGHNWNRNYCDLTTEAEEDFKSFIKKCEDLSPAQIGQNFKKFLVETCGNLMKSFSSYGPNQNKKLNLLLQKIAAPADIVLDFHTGPKAARYLYSTECQKESARHFLFPYTLFIPESFAGAMDEACFYPWTYLQKELQAKKKIFPLSFEAYTVELGGEEKICFQEASLDAQRILNYLHHKKILPSPPTLSSPSFSNNQYFSLLKDYKTYYAPQGGLVEFKATCGQHLKSGECLYRLLNFQNLREEKDWPKVIHKEMALEDCIVINHAPSSAIEEGQEVYQVMENFKKF